MKKLCIAIVVFSFSLLIGCATKVTSTGQLTADASSLETLKINSLAIIYTAGTDVPPVLIGLNTRIADRLEKNVRAVGLHSAIFPSMSLKPAPGSGGANLNARSIVKNFSHVLGLSVNSFHQYGSSVNVKLTANIQDIKSKKVIWKYTASANGNDAEAIASEMTEKLKSSGLIQ